MPCSPEQLAANRRNASLSSGPKTTEGKAISRRNGLKHGLAGEGIALPDEDAQEVEVMAANFRHSFQPGDCEAEVMVRRLAVMAVRMDRCVEYETATLSGKVREAMNDPSHETEAARREAIALAKFDHSPESGRVRRYEAAASREFFKTLKALKSRDPADMAPQPAMPGFSNSTPRTTSSELGSSRSSTPPAPAPVVAPARPRETTVSVPDLVPDYDFLNSILGPVSAKDARHFAIGKAPRSSR